MKEHLIPATIVCVKSFLFAFSQTKLVYMNLFYAFFICIVVVIFGVMYIVFIITNYYSLEPSRFLVFVLYPILYKCAKHVVLC